MMLFRKNTRQDHQTLSTVVPARRAAQLDISPEEAELRRQMYERIACGNALADAEETAERRYTGQ